MAKKHNHNINVSYQSILIIINLFFGVFYIWNNAKLMAQLFLLSSFHSTLFFILIFKQLLGTVVKP